MTYNTEHSDPIATVKASDTTYCKSTYLADELQHCCYDTSVFGRHVTQFKMERREEQIST